MSDDGFIARIRLPMFTIDASGPLGRVDFEWSTDHLADSVVERRYGREPKKSAGVSGAGA